MTPASPTAEPADGVRRVPAGTGAALDVLGVTLCWKRAAGPDAAALIELTVPAGAGVPLHAHPSAETFYVLDGVVEFARLDARGPQWLPAGPGDTIAVAGGAMHGFRNAGAAPVRLLVSCDGALEAFFRAAGRPLPAPPPDGAEVDRVLAVARRHGQVFAPPS